MDVVSTCPLRVSSRAFPTALGMWALTVVCKATYRLTPGESPLDPEQDEPNAEDNYWDDDPGRSLYSPGDVVPFKRRADVILVGHAFAAGGVPVRSIRTRLIVGEVDKSIEAWCDRIFTQDRQLLEGPPIAKMSLRYERAAVGPATANPVGMRLDTPDIYGAIHLPNLQPAGAHIMSPADFTGATGYGPIAPTWPARAERLGRLAETFWSRAWYEQPLPEGFDPAFFNVAPADQQVSALRDNERIILENLHPEHPRLVTSLCGVRPRAVVKRAGQAAEDVELACDTLWIDTALGICTLVWRGRVDLTRRDEAGQVVISIDDRRRRAVDEDAVSITQTSAPETQRPDYPDPDNVGTMPIRFAARRAVMPFVPSAPGAPPMSGIQAPPVLAAPPPIAPAGPEESGSFDILNTTVTSAENLLDDTLPFKRRAPSQINIEPAALPPPPPLPPPPQVVPPPPQVVPPPPQVVPPPSSRPLLQLQSVPQAVSPLQIIPQAVPPLQAAPQVVPPPPLAASKEVPPEPPMIGPLATPEIAPPSPPPAAAPPSQPIEARASAPAAPAAPTAPAEAPVPIEQCAAIAASIARRKPDTALILEEHKITPSDWTALERHWSDAIRKETDRGKTGLLATYDAAYVAQLEQERGPITVEEYARLVVASERGGVGDALAELKLPRGAMLKIERVWLAKVAEDTALAGTIRRAIEAARQD